MKQAWNRQEALDKDRKPLFSGKAGGCSDDEGDQRDLDYEPEKALVIMCADNESWRKGSHRPGRK